MPVLAQALSQFAAIRSEVGLKIRRPNISIATLATTHQLTTNPRRRFAL
jgi:hypothetical protein